MVGNVAEMFARMKKIDRLFVRLKPFKKCPVIGCGVGDSDEPKVGSHFPNVGDLFRDLCFQRYLASFRPKYNVSKRLPSASWKLTVPQDAQHASSRPLERSATPSSETAKETASVGTGFAFVSRATSPFSFQRLPAVTKRRRRWLDDGFMPPSFSKSLAASLGVQWSMTKRAR